MSHLHAITGDTDDEALRQLVRDSLKDKWSFLNDLEQTQLLYEAHEYRKQLMDQRPIIDLLDAQPRFPVATSHCSSSPTPFPYKGFSPYFYTAYTMATYSRELFRHLQNSSHPKPSIPPELSYSMIEDAHHIVELAAQAYHTRSM
jgi:hypothetical protein